MKFWGSDGVGNCLVVACLSVIEQHVPFETVIGWTGSSLLALYGQNGMISTSLWLSLRTPWKYTPQQPMEFYNTKHHGIMWQRSCDRRKLYHLTKWHMRLDPRWLPPLRINEEIWLVITVSHVTTTANQYWLHNLEHSVKLYLGGGGVHPSYWATTCNRSASNKTQALPTCYNNSIVAMCW